MSEDLSLEEFRQGNYQTLAALVQKFPTRWLNRITGRFTGAPSGGEEPPENCIEVPLIIPYLRKNPEMVQRVAGELARWGVTKISPYAEGSLCIIAETTPHQLVRLALTNDEEFPEHELPDDLWEVLQPLKSERAKDRSCLLQLLPRVEPMRNQEDITGHAPNKRDICALALSLAKKRVLVF